MKRYRCTAFYLDCLRNYPEQSEIKQFISEQYGGLDLEGKIRRYLLFKPPSLQIITEYHDLLHQIEDSYIYGLYYPTLTSACCLGERIFNILILRLREYYKTSEHYKKVYNKQSFLDWDDSLKILWDWGVLTSEEIKKKYEELKEIRHQNSIHFSVLEDMEGKALNALKIVYDITAYFFAIGLRKDIYFWCPGEIYIRKEIEQSPFVKEMILPSCSLVGYKHTIEKPNKSFIINDKYLYEDRYISDDEFIKLRNKFKGI